MCIHVGPCKHNLHFCHSKILTCSCSNRMAEIMMHTSGWYSDWLRYQTAQVNIKLSLWINTMDSRTGLNVVVMRKVHDSGKSQTLVIQPLTASRYEAAHIVIRRIQNWERNYSNLSKKIALHHWCIL
jgi:hypothetical protein